MNPDQQRRLAGRAFLATGRDGLDGVIRYADLLEQAVLELDRQLHDRGKRQDRAFAYDVAYSWLRK